jgi:hypothetical protein
LNKTGSLKTELLSFKIYNKIVAIKAAWYWHKKTDT